MQIALRKSHVNEATKVKLYSYRQVLGVCQNFAARGRPWGTGPPNVNFVSPDISETTIARKLNLKIPLDVVKYSLWVHKLSYYTIYHEGGRHIDFRQN